MSEYAEIIPVYERRWAERPDSYYFVPLANAYRAVGQHQQAIDTLKEGLERHSDYLGARAALAAAYFSANLHAEAEEEIQRVLSTQPRNLLIRRLLVACHREAGREEEAQAEARRLQGIMQAQEGHPAKEAEEEVLAVETPPAEVAEEEVLVVETPPAEVAPPPPPEGPKGLQLGPVLEALVDDASAIKEIQSLFSSGPPPEEEEPTSDAATTLEGWLDTIERRRGEPPSSR